jgi:hypothetical protein
MQDCKPVKVPIPVGARLTVEQCPKTQEEIEDMAHVPYASVVGSLMYAMVCTRPDISHAVGVLRRYMSTPGKEHWTTVKRVFRYLCGTKDYAICYQGKPGGDSGKLDVHGFVDADWAGDLDRRRSTNGYVFKMFSGAISWMSKRQVVIALSTTEVEYMAATHGSKEVVWLQRLCSGIRFEQRAMKVSCDSQSTIFLAKNPAYHSKTKHIDVQYHFIRDMVESNKVLLEKVDTLENIADSLTKSVSVVKFSWCREAMGIVSLGL